MGHKPSKPTVSYEEAIEGLELTLEELTAEYKLMTVKDKGLPRKVFMKNYAGNVGQFGNLVEERLYQVLGIEGTHLSLEDYAIGKYVFTDAPESVRLRVIFEMFDVKGNGCIKKKDFKNMTMSIIKGDRNVGNFEADFKQLSKVMIDSAMLSFDVNRDGKLSYEEWLTYANEDNVVQDFLMEMNKPSDK